MTPEVRQQLTANMSTTQTNPGSEAFRWKSIPQGAATSVWAAVVGAADEVGGRYCEDCRVAELTEGSG
jgi:hypothetical protein